jgi:hypothetical protein
MWFRIQDIDIDTCKAFAVSNATVGLTALLLLTNSKKRSKLSIKTCNKIRNEALYGMRSEYWKEKRRRKNMSK